MSLPTGHGIMGPVTPKAPASAVIRVDVGEELRALRMQGLKQVATMAELRARVGALEQRWSDAQAHRSAVKATSWTAVITAIGTLGYLLLSAHG